eukprot:GHVU01163091.1.p1 GENE.GHVU01163091.1~~GHVU01163091.1.p1  ORF type:complete len:152 (+),score=18.19 GHVU01163091.1:1015-1470(+)
MGRPPTQTELELQYQESPEQYLTRTVDTVEINESSSRGEEESLDRGGAGMEVEAPPAIGDPASWHPSSMITSTPAVQGGMVAGDPMERVVPGTTIPDEESPRTGPQPARVSAVTKIDSTPRDVGGTIENNCPAASQGAKAAPELLDRLEST